MRPGPSRDHDPPKKRHLDADGNDTRAHRDIKPLPGDHPNRAWHDSHLDAGYHLQAWHPVQPDHPGIGLYKGSEGLFEVRYLEEGHTGAPEYEIEWEDGMRVTVLDHLVAGEYVDMHQAKRTRQRKDLARWADHLQAAADAAEEEHA